MLEAVKEASVVVLVAATMILFAVIPAATKPEE